MDRGQSVAWPGLAGPADKLELPVGSPGLTSELVVRCQLCGFAADEVTPAIVLQFSQATTSGCDPPLAGEAVCQGCRLTADLALLLRATTIATCRAAPLVRGRETLRRSRSNRRRASHHLLQRTIEPYPTEQNNGGLLDVVRRRGKHWTDMVLPPDGLRSADASLGPRCIAFLWEPRWLIVKTFQRKCSLDNVTLVFDHELLLRSTSKEADKKSSTSGITDFASAPPYR
ncbi:hypothetical protein TgHK011_006814 [Trichoderma gracile]|nr:hypothetical protein TgHK011_006814 [Trichoderma gracile]